MNYGSVEKKKCGSFMALKEKIFIFFMVSKSNKSEKSKVYLTA